MFQEVWKIGEGAWTRVGVRLIGLITRRGGPPGGLGRADWSKGLSWSLVADWKITDENCGEGGGGGC